ncbi:MAG: Hpy99I family type II restriction endonuclease [Alphaproteobacteria bacterium]|nr:Hpy99I family type II restriction endonuclease [Alphaproteobacteria bacterium]
MAPKFVFLSKNISIYNTILEKYLVGIVLSEKDSDVLVQFSCLEKPISLNKKNVHFFDPTKTGDAFDKKVCNVCCKLLDTSLFSKNQNGKNNRSVRRPSCDNCRKVIDGVSMSASEKNKWNKIKPNMEIFECPICRKKTIPGLTSKVVLDHDHKTGKGRAWICDSCNTGLGRFKDDIELLESAIQYLKKG